MNFKPNKELKNMQKESATRSLEVDTDVNQDAIAHARMNIEISKALKEGSLKSGVYRG